MISECSKLAQSEYKNRHNSIGKGDPRGIVQEIKLWPSYQMVYAQTGICPKKIRPLKFFTIQMDHLILGRRLDLVLNDKMN